MTKILGLYRAERFSPNSVEKDRLILQAVGAELQAMGYEVSYLTEEELTADTPCQVVMTMGRLKQTQQILAQKEAEGTVVVNSPESITACARAKIDAAMRQHHIPAAPLTGTDGWWIKRGDEAAQSHDDVRFAATEAERESIVADFKKLGIDNIVITAHVKGDLLKFYGVAGTPFFKVYYPSDDGQFKFGDEQFNGQAHHFGFNMVQLSEQASRLAALTGLMVYGGDCIVRKDGTFAIIDFNDWPSFSRCRQEAAHAIAAKVAMMAKEKGWLPNRQ